MATITVVNLSSSPVFLRDFYCTLGASGVKDSTVGPIDTLTTTAHAADEVTRMAGLMDLVTEGTVSVTVTPSASESASGLMQAPLSVDDQDVAAVAAATLFSPASVVLRIPHAALAAAAQDTLTVALGAIPYKFRVLDAKVKVSTVASAANTVQLWTRAAGTGTAITTAISTDTTLGLRVETATAVTAGAVVTPSALDGIYVKDSAKGDWVGEIILTVRKET